MSGLTRRAADRVESGGWIMHAFSFGKIGAASVRPDSIVDSMNPRHLSAVVESFYADVWNRQDTSRIPRLLDPHFTFRGSLGETRTGHDGFASYLGFVHGAVSGFTCDILELVV